MSKLLFKPSIHCDECLVSYLIRLSHNNGFKNIVYLLRCAGFDWGNNRLPIRSILSGEFDLSSYVSKMGLQHAKPPAADVYRTFRRVIDTPYVFVKFPKVCLQCLNESGYCRFHWAFLSVVACNQHQNLLSDTFLGKSSSWYRGRIDDFDNRHESSLLLQENIKSSIFQFNAYIESLILNRPQSLKYPEILNGLSFREALTLVNFLAHYLGRLLNQPFNPYQMSNELIAFRYVAIWDILNHWPAGFYEFLSKFIEIPLSSKGLAGVNKHYKDFNEQLFRRRGNQGIAVIRKEFDQFISFHWPGPLEVSRFKRITLSGSSTKFISKKDAAVIIKCHPDRIGKLVKSKRLSEVKFKGQLCYSLEDVKSLATLLSENWTISQACGALQLTRYQLKQLLDAEMLVAIQKPDAVNRDWVIDRVQSEGFIKKLISGARSGIGSSKCISVEGVQHQGFSFSQLIAAMQNGTVEYGFSRIPDFPYSFKQFVDFTVNK
jgi:hypothetical protein